MLNIYITRHGQDEDNANGILNGRRDTPLTQKGLEQAKEVAKKIKQKDLKLHKIYSSPLQRAYKTAEIIAKEIGCRNLEKNDILIEREFGIMTGKPLSKIKELCSPNVLETTTITYFLNPLNAETFPQLLKRANKILRTIKKNHTNDNILLVTHGDLGKMIYCAYYNLNWKEVLEMFHFGNSDLLLMSQNSKAEEAHVFRTKQHNL